MHSRKPPHEGGPTVLALMLHPGCSGYAALDGYGKRAFGTTRLSRIADRASILVRLLHRLARQARPVRVVLGIPPHDRTLNASLREVARRTCRRLHLNVVTRPLGHAFDRLGVADRAPSRNSLARYLIDHYVPELFHKFTARVERLWQRRPAWHALALAMSELVDVSPLSAAALAPAAGHRVPSFSRALQGAISAV